MHTMQSVLQLVIRRRKQAFHSSRVCAFCFSSKLFQPARLSSLARDLLCIMCPHLCLLGGRRKTSLPTCGELFSCRWDQVPSDLNQMTDTRAKTKQTTWCRTTYITFPLTTLIYWSLCLSLKNCALSHAWFLSFQNNMFDSYLMHSWKQLLVKICVVGKAEEVSVSNNQKFTTFWKTCFNFPRLRWQSMSYFQTIFWKFLA